MRDRLEILLDDFGIYENIRDAAEGLEIELNDKETKELIYIYLSNLLLENSDIEIFEKAIKDFKDLD